mmetsp:Transcript_666/g.1742  ORF Transcript_666/g.1742 Transcript_666/m.1742 type:complete len:236 (-) Transcript_666:125-832(-)
MGARGGGMCRSSLLSLASSRRSAAAPWCVWCALSPAGTLGRNRRPSCFTVCALRSLWLTRSLSRYVRARLRPTAASSRADSQLACDGEISIWAMLVSSSARSRDRDLSSAAAMLSADAEAAAPLAHVSAGRAWATWRGAASPTARLPICVVGGALTGAKGGAADTRVAAGDGATGDSGAAQLGGSGGAEGRRRRSVHAVPCMCPSLCTCSVEPWCNASSCRTILRPRPVPPFPCN